MNEFLRMVSQIPGAILQLPGILLQLAVIAAAITTIFTCLRILAASIQTVINLVNTLSSKGIRKENSIIIPSMKDIRDYGKPLVEKNEPNIYEKQEEHKFILSQSKQQIANDNISINRDRIDVLYTIFIFIISVIYTKFIYIYISDNVDIIEFINLKILLLSFIISVVAKRLFPLKLSARS